MKTIASVHRFQDKVAIYVGEIWSTTYLTVEQARALSKALAVFADSVVNEEFVEDRSGKVDIKEVTYAQEGAEVRKFPRNKEKAK